MKLYEPSIFLTSRHSMTFTGISNSNDIRPAVDNDKNTLASSNAANPSFSVNFGTGQTRDGVGDLDSCDGLHAGAGQCGIVGGGGCGDRS